MANFFEYVVTLNVESLFSYKGILDNRIFCNRKWSTCITILFLHKVHTNNDSMSCIEYFNPNRHVSATANSGLIFWKAYKRCFRCLHTGWHTHQNKSFLILNTDYSFTSANTKCWYSKARSLFYTWSPKFKLFTHNTIGSRDGQSQITHWTVCKILLD